MSPILPEIPLNGFVPNFVCRFPRGRNLLCQILLHSVRGFDITKLILDEWQEIWNCCAGNKLHAIKPTVGDYIQKTCLSRRDSVLLKL